MEGLVLFGLRACSGQIRSLQRLSGHLLEVLPQCDMLCVLRASVRALPFIVMTSGFTSGTFAETGAERDWPEGP